jgi:hypothetical protein
VAQDGDQRWTVANTGIKFFSIKDGEFLTSWSIFKNTAALSWWQYMIYVEKSFLGHGIVDCAPCTKTIQVRPRETELLKACYSTYSTVVLVSDSARKCLFCLCSTVTTQIGLCVLVSSL